MQLNVAAVAPPTAAARGALLAALTDGDDDDFKLVAKVLDDALTSTTERVQARPGGKMGRATYLGGFLQREPGGQCSASLVAGALTREDHAILMLFANTMVGAWDSTAAAGHIELPKVPDRAPYQQYYAVLGRGAIDPATCGLTETDALTELGAVGAALTKVTSYLTTDDPHPPVGEMVYIVEVMKAKGASGTVSFVPQELAWHHGVKVALPLDTTLFMTAKGCDGAYLSQRAVKPTLASQISPVAEGVQLTTCFDGTMLRVFQRRVADGLEVGFDARASVQVKERAGRAQRIAMDCINVSNAFALDAAACAWTAFTLPKPVQARAGAGDPSAGGLAGALTNINATLKDMQGRGGEGAPRGRRGGAEGAPRGAEGRRGAPRGRRGGAEGAPRGAEE
eukprot:gene17849-47741_t